MNKGQPHSWARPLYLSHHGGGKKGASERETRRMEKNSFDQSLKPITRRKLLTRGLSLSFSPSLCSLCIFLFMPPPFSLSPHFLYLLPFPLSRHLISFFSACISHFFSHAHLFAHLFTLLPDLLHLFYISCSTTREYSILINYCFLFLCTSL